MTKRIPKPERRLEWEEEELRRRMLRRNDAADALEKAEADLQTQERIVALMRGEEFGSSTFGTGDTTSWGPDGNLLIPVEPLVGQPGAAQVHVQVGDADVAVPASKITVEGGTDSGGTLPLPPDNAPNGGDWKVYHEEQERLAELAEQEAIDRAAAAMHAKPSQGNELPERLLLDTSPVPGYKGGASVEACTPPRHYFSNTKGLPIGTPCFCGARAWGVDPAKAEVGNHMRPVAGVVTDKKFEFDVTVQVKPEGAKS